MPLIDPVTGPMPREKFRELVALPAGKAREAIQEYDPLWGRRPGEKIEWRIRVERSGRDTGTAFVKAATEKEAEALAENLTSDAIDWDFEDDSFEITEVQAVTAKNRHRF
jgi:hypothetical protein